MRSNPGRSQAGLWSAWSKPGGRGRRVSPSRSHAAWNCRTTISRATGGRRLGIGNRRRQRVADESRSSAARYGRADGAGDRGGPACPIDVSAGPIKLIAVMLDYPIDGSAVRRPGAAVVSASSARSTPEPRSGHSLTRHSGAGPDCDEIRMLTGRAAPANRRMVFLRQLGDGRRRLPRLHLVEPQSAGRRRAVPGSAVRLRLLGLPATARRRAPGPLRGARGTAAGAGADIGPLRAAGGSSLFVCPGRRRSKETGGQARVARDRSK